MNRKHTIRRRALGAILVPILSGSLAARANPELVQGPHPTDARAQATFPVKLTVEGGGAVLVRTDRDPSKGRTLGTITEGQSFDFPVVAGQSLYFQIQPNAGFHLGNILDETTWAGTRDLTRALGWDHWLAMEKMGGGRTLKVAFLPGPAKVQIRSDASRCEAAYSQDGVQWMPLAGGSGALNIGPTDRLKVRLQPKNGWRLGSLDLNGKVGSLLDASNTFTLSQVISDQVLDAHFVRNAFKELFSNGTFSDRWWLSMPTPKTDYYTVDNGYLKVKLLKGASQAFGGLRSEFAMVDACRGVDAVYDAKADMNYVFDMQLGSDFTDVGGRRDIFAQWHQVDGVPAHSGHEGACSLMDFPPLALSVFGETVQEQVDGATVTRVIPRFQVSYYTCDWVKDPETGKMVRSWGVRHDHTIGTVTAEDKNSRVNWRVRIKWGEVEGDSEVNGPKVIVYRNNKMLFSRINTPNTMDPTSVRHLDASCVEANKAAMLGTYDPEDISPDPSRQEYWWGPYFKFGIYNTWPPVSTSPMYRSIGFDNLYIFPAM